MDQTEKNKGKFLAFLLGLIVGGRILPWFIHLLYWTIIVAVFLFKK